VEEEFLDATDSARRRIDGICTSIDDMPFGPFECKAMNDCLERVVGCMHSIVLYYSDKSREAWSSADRLGLSLRRLLDARERLAELKYELKKVR